MRSEQHLSPLLNEQEAIRWLRLDETNVKSPGSSLKRYREQGRLKAVRIGRCVRYPTWCLEEFIRQEIARDRSART